MLKEHGMPLDSMKLVLNEDLSALNEDASHVLSLNERLTVSNPHDEIGHLAGVFNDTFERLENAFEEMKRFTSDASHELRTPLTALRAVGEVSLQAPDNPEAHREAIRKRDGPDRLHHLPPKMLAQVTRDPACCVVASGI